MSRRQSLGLLVMVAVATQASPAAASEEADPVPAAEDADPVRRDSTAPVDLDEEWQSLGFRLNLNLGYGFNLGDQAGPDMQSVSIGVSAGLRIDRWWGLMGTLRYGVMREGFNGLRWGATVEPVFYLTTGIGVAVGVGYGGLLGGRPQAGEYDYERYVTDPDRIDIGDTVVGEPPPFPACDGDGLLTLARVFWAFPISDLFSTGAQLQVDAQWTQCVDHGFDELVPVETRHLVPTQWWAHYGIELMWVTSWR